MRLAVVTPLAPSSAVADVTMQALPIMAERWDVDVWCPAAPRYRSCPVDVIPFSGPLVEVVAALTEYDLVVYVVGDAAVHSSIIWLSRLLPGMVVLHDASITNATFASVDHHGGWPQLVAAAEANAPAEAVSTLLGRSGPFDEDEWLAASAAAPFHEVVTTTALGVVVHSEWHAGLIGPLPFGSVSVARSMPVVRTAAVEAGTSDPAWVSRLEELDEDDVLMVTVGAVNPNRCLDLLIEALDEPKAERVKLWVVGRGEPKRVAELEDLARRRKVDRRVVFTGGVDEATLATILARGDIGAALRDPVLEGQSASLMRQMAEGLPVLVLDHAHYRELPVGSVVPIDPGDRSASVRRTITQLAGDPTARARIGAAARSHVASHTGEAYGAEIVAAAEQALAARPLARLNAAIGRRLRRRDMSGSPVVLDRVVTTIEGLLDPFGG